MIKRIYFGDIHWHSTFGDGDVKIDEMYKNAVADNYLDFTATTEHKLTNPFYHDIPFPIIKMLIDSHCHLNFPEYKDDLEDVLAKAREIGVKAFITVSTKLNEINTLYELCNKCNDVFCSVGSHQNENVDISNLYENIKSFCVHPKVVGIGETGIDNFFNRRERRMLGPLRSGMNQRFVHI